MTSPSASPALWKKGPERLLLSTRVFDVYGVHQRNRSRGTDREFVVIKAHDWVNVVAVTPEAEVVLVRQFRVGIGELSLEIPGGVMEPGEDPVQAGLRELREETGYAGGSARLMASVHSNPAIQSNRTHYVLVEGAIQEGQPQWDADEDIQTLTAPVEQVLEWARQGRITHSLVVGALFHFEGIWRARGGHI